MSRFFMLSLIALVAPAALAATAFQITDDSTERGHLRIVKVALPKRISEREIGEIAQKIYLKNYPITSIHFRVQGQTMKGVWAVAKFDPEMEIILYEASQNVQEELLKNQPPDDGKKIGSWLNTGVISYRITIVESSNGSFRAHLFFSDKTSHTEKLTVKTVNEQVRYYVDSAAWNKYYAIGADGYLQYWADKRGMYATLAPAK